MGGVEAARELVRKELPVPWIILVLSVLIFGIVIAVWLLISLDAAQLIVSAMIPLVVVIIGYWIDRRLREYQEAMKARHDPLFQFRIEADFHGPEQGFYLGEFRFTAHNIGYMEQDISNINLQVRGMKEGEEPEIWENSEYRLLFPHAVLETNILLREILVKPDVEQLLNFVTMIDDDFKYILARARIEHLEPDIQQQFIERMFVLPQGQ